MMPTNNQVILNLDDYNAMRDELRVLKEEIANAVSAEPAYGGERSARIEVSALEGTYLRTVIDAKAKEVFKGPVAFEEKLEINSWNVNNLLFVEPGDEEEEEIESALEDL